MDRFLRSVQEGVGSIISRYGLNSKAEEAAGHFYKLFIDRIIFEGDRGSFQSDHVEGVWSFLKI